VRTAHPLGWRRELESDRAEELYPFAAPIPAKVEKRFTLPGWIETHDQGREGSCVGHAVALERSLVNTAQLRPGSRAYRRYDPIKLWRAAKDVDEWTYTKPEDDKGTSVRAAYQIAHEQGLYRVRSMKVEAGRPVAVGEHGSPDASAGVAAYRWARTVDDVRAAIGAGAPVAIGVQWFSGFDEPQELRTGWRRRKEFWLPLPANAGRVRGGHSVCLAGASDRRGAFLLVNSWGPDYPPAWMPYAMLEELLRQRGEAAIVTDL
jgi:hypothetical protein